MLKEELKISNSRFIFHNDQDSTVQAVFCYFSIREVIVTSTNGVINELSRSDNGSVDSSRISGSAVFDNISISVKLATTWHYCYLKLWIRSSNPRKKRQFRISESTKFQNYLSYQCCLSILGADKRSAWIPLARVFSSISFTITIVIRNTGTNIVSFLTTVNGIFDTVLLKI